MCFFLAADLNYPNAYPDFDCKNKYDAHDSYHFSMKKKEKMRHVRFLPKVVTICSEKKKDLIVKTIIGAINWPISS